MTTIWISSMGIREWDIPAVELRLWEICGILVEVIPLVDNLLTRQVRTRMILNGFWWFHLGEKNRRLQIGWKGGVTFSFLEWCMQYFSGTNSQDSSLFC